MTNVENRAIRIFSPPTGVALSELGSRELPEFRDLLGRGIAWVKRSVAMLSQQRS